MKYSPKANTNPPQNPLRGLKRLNNLQRLKLLKILKSPVYKNAVILGLSGTAAKLFDFFFRAVYSRVLGDDGMGLLSLTLSLHGVMLTVATAGMGVAVSALVSVYEEKQNPQMIKSCTNTAVAAVAIGGALITALTFLLSPYLAQNILGDKDAAYPLCAACPSVIFMGVSYCTKGCFYALRKVSAPAKSEILEQAAKFAAVSVLLKLFAPYGRAAGCVGVLLGMTLGEGASCAYLLVRLKRLAAKNYGIPDFGSKYPKKGTPKAGRVLLMLISAAAPCMLTSLFSGVLRVKEETLLVSCFKAGGASHKDALSALGIMHQMTMPLLVLPLTLMGSAMSLLVPEVSRAKVRGSARLNKVVKKIYTWGVGIGVIVGAFFVFFGRGISYALYKNDKAAAITSYLAPLCPVMMLDSLSVSVLNGTGNRGRLFVFTLLDFVLRFGMIWAFVPRYKFGGFAAMTAVSNLFTCALTTWSVISCVRHR